MTDVLKYKEPAPKPSVAEVIDRMAERGTQQGYSTADHREYSLQQNNHV